MSIKDDLINQAKEQNKNYPQYRNHFNDCKLGQAKNKIRSLSGSSYLFDKLEYLIYKDVTEKERIQSCLSPGQYIIAFSSKIERFAYIKMSRIKVIENDVD